MENKIAEESFVRFLQSGQEQWLQRLQSVSKRPLRVSKNVNGRPSQWVLLPDAGFPVDYRTVLHNEVVFDIDSKRWNDVKMFAEIVSVPLIKMDVPYFTAYTGGRGIHLHFFFSLSEDQKRQCVDMDVMPKDMRMWLFHYILHEARISPKLIGPGKPFDTSVVNWSDEGKGHLIRVFGGKKCKYKTLLTEIPEERPNTDEVAFVDDVALWKIPDTLFKEFINDFKKSQKKRVEASKLYQKASQNFSGKYLSLPCIQKVLAGLPEGQRNTGAHVLAIAARLDGVSKEEAEKVMLSYAGNCPQDNISENEYIGWINWIYSQKNTFWNCRFCKELELCEKDCQFHKAAFKDILEFLKSPDLIKRIDKILGKPIKKDRKNRMLAFFVCLSAYGSNPLNLFLKGESSIGKTHIAKTVAEYFPDEDVWFIGDMSPKALFHEHGKFENGKVYISLENKVLVFMETPRRETLEMLKPILSHDRKEIEYKIADKKTSGQLGTKNVIIKGWPATIFCTTDHKYLEELSTRSMVATPEVSHEKIAQVLEYKGEKYAKPWESNKGEPLFKKVLQQLKTGIEVCIPYGKQVGHWYNMENKNEPRVMRDYDKLMEIVEQGDHFLLKKVIDDQEWLKTAEYPVVIDSSTQGEIADPWEQQELTPYGQYFKNFNEYVDPLTGHLTIRHTDYSLSGRGLDISVTRVYSTAVAYKQEEDGSGEYVPVATYKMAPTDLGCGWSLDFPWLEIDADHPGTYFHTRNGAQVRTQFQNGVWLCDEYGFTMYVNGDDTYTTYRDNGIKEEYDSMGRITSITDLNQNQVTFTYYPYGIASITDTVGRIITFSYSGYKLTSITDGTRTISYNYSGDKLVSVTDPLGRVTSYVYLSENSFLITGVHYPSGEFSSYEYTAVVPSFAKVAPYKSLETDNGETDYYVYKVDSQDTVSWTSPKDLNTVTVSAGRPCVFQRDDGSLVMYFKDKYVWTEPYWKCVGGDCWEEPVTHTEYWIKRSTSTDQHHWSTPQNVVQVKNTTGNPVVIEKQDGSFIMYYKDKYVWTEEECEWVGRFPDIEYVCETTTHTEYWIYQRTSSDGLIWGSLVKVQKTTLNVTNIAAIQKYDSTFLMCYTDKVGSSYYIRQKTSSNGTSWSAPSNVVLVNSSTGNPALLQGDTGTVFLAYQKGSNIYVLSNAGSGWSTPVQTTATAEGDPALLQTETDIVIIYKGTDHKCYRISSVDGTTWSSPSQIAPNIAISDPATGDRKDRFYRVTAQYISASLIDLVRVTEYSYEGNGYLANSTDVIICDAQTLQSSMHFEYDSKGRTVKRISKDEQSVQTEKIRYTYNNADKMIRQDVYAGTSTAISYSVMTGYDSWGNIIYTRNPEGAEHYYSYGNTNGENQFVDSKGVPVSLFSNTFYTNTIPSECHTLIVGHASINSGKVTETYYKYNTYSNLTETKTLFPTRNYAVFSGTFDENGQPLNIDLTGLTLTDGILVISSIPVPTVETLHEIHSEVGKGWLTTGTWSGKYFMADYYKCYDFEDCFDGQTKIGPFEHYPGTPNYTGYTTWVEDNTQYVKTSYTAVINEYPETVEYNLNNNSWTTIIENLGSGTTSTTIPASFFVQGLNTLQFKESNTYSTKFDWALYIDQGAVPQEYVNSMTYDSYGNMTSFTDALGNTALFGYDSNMYLTSVTNALTQTMTATYDFNTGWLTSVTDAKGNTTLYEYDLLGRVTRKIHPDLTEVKAVYDDSNNTVTIFDELDHYVIYSYDCCGRSRKTEYYLSPTTALTERYTYTYQNNVKTVTDPGGHIYSYEYDALGRLTKVINPDSTFTQAVYDDITNTVTVLDENQHKIEYHYDWVGNLVQVKEYTDAVNYYLTQYTYDDAGNITSFTDGNGNTTSYTYNLFGITCITYPDSTTETFSYDSIGHVIQRTYPQGLLTFTYNSIYQLVTIAYADATSISYEYDANGNRTTMTDCTGQTTYSYDSRNRLISETRTGENQYTITYAYDAASRLVSMTYPDQSIVTYEYDWLNRLTTIPGYAQFSYNQDSLPTTVTYENGITTTYQYDNRDRTTNMDAEGNGTDFLSLNYQYDFSGNVTQLDYKRRSPNQQWVQSVETFQYDWLDRLIAAQGDYGTLVYSYDPAGNRLSHNGLTYTYNVVNELVSINDGTTFTYDDNGNRTAKTKGPNTWVYTYDYANRLTKVEENGITKGEYVYDGDGKRIQKTENGETTTYSYTGLNVLYEETIIGTACYIYGSTGRLAKRTEIQGETHTYFYHTDHLGSTRLVTESQNVVTEVAYKPFGEPITGEESYLYTGKEKDATGLYYYGARYYDCDTGTFITKDPLAGRKGIPQSLNRYTYCLNNPVTLVDPAGLTARMCNIDTGICTRDTVNGWLATNENGDTLSLSDIQQKIDEGDYVGAVKLILEFLGYEIIGQGTTTEKAGEDEIEVDFLHARKDGNTTQVRIYGTDDMEILAPGATRDSHPMGGAQPNTNFFLRAIVCIYFFSDVNMTAEELFHTVGHEMVHAEHYATGVFEEWKKKWNLAAAAYYSEYLAHRWNLLHLNIVNFPGAQERYEDWMRGYLRLFFKAIK